MLRELVDQQMLYLEILHQTEKVKNQKDNVFAEAEDEKKSRDSKTRETNKSVEYETVDNKEQKHRAVERIRQRSRSRSRSQNRDSRNSRYSSTSGRSRDDDEHRRHHHRREYLSLIHI